MIAALYCKVLFRCIHSGAFQKDEPLKSTCLHHVFLYFPMPLTFTGFTQTLKPPFYKCPNWSSFVPRWLCRRYNAHHLLLCSGVAPDSTRGIRFSETHLFTCPSSSFTRSNVSSIFCLQHSDFLFQFRIPCTCILLELFCLLYSSFQLLSCVLSLLILFFPCLLLLVKSAMVFREIFKCIINSISQMSSFSKLVAHCLILLFPLISQILQHSEQLHYAKAMNVHVELISRFFCNSALLSPRFPNSS